VEVVKPKPKPKPVKPKIKVNLKSTMRQPDTQKVKAQQAAAERARQAEAKRQAALKQSLNKLDSKLSGRTSVNVPQGRYAAANYESLIRRKYVDATIHPGTISGDPVVKVQLVIARNGNVISARIIGVSGLAIWDRAVQKALDRVKRIAPFPAGMSGAKKTFNLNFNSRSFQ
jgi:protein TonB